MLISAIIFFVIAALLGFYLLTFVLQNKETPKGIAFTHGPLASVGLILLIIYALLYKPAPIIALIIFVLAVLGGVMLIYRDIYGKSIPKWLAMGHGLIALTGLVFLLVFAMK